MILLYQTWWLLQVELMKFPSLMNLKREKGAGCMPFPVLNF